MIKHIKTEFIVGLFIICSVLALFFLAFKVSGVSGMGAKSHFVVSANFDNIGDLKASAAVTLAGVKVGEVSSISLDPNTMQAIVKLNIMDRFKSIPDDSEASILTQGLLGSNYIGLMPGFSETPLKNGSAIHTTHSAIILENIIGQLVYSLKGDNKKTESQ